MNQASCGRRGGNCQCTSVEECILDRAPPQEALSQAMEAVEAAAAGDCEPAKRLMARVEPWPDGTPAAEMSTALRKRVAEFLLQHDPFGDTFSRHEINLIEGRRPIPLSDPYEIAARNAGWTIVPDEFGGIFERSASDEPERVHFNGDLKRLCEFAAIEVARD